MHKDCLIGSDPEFVLFDPKTSLHVEAAAYFTASKDVPEKVNDTVSYLVDNVNLELNIKPAANSKEWFDSNRIAMDVLNDLVAPKKILWKAQQVSSFHPQHLTKLESMVFGCEPDFNVWSNKVQILGNPPWPGFRSAGGHIHVGIRKKLNRREKILLGRLIEVNTCDLISSNEDEDHAANRRSFYGKPGSIRFKPYGIEYRVPGPEWVLYPQGKLEQLYDNIITSIMELDNILNGHLAIDHKLNRVVRDRAKAKLTHRE